VPAALPSRRTATPAWWQDETIYQIYPRSFADSNGDGVGDLAGIRSRLDYLEALGIGAIWLSPIYPSPMADFGYDVSDYCDIEPTFGTLEDFDALLADAHARDLKVILDWVPNHTSEEHPWFLESRSSRTSPKRDWYVWRDPAPDGGPPNTWVSTFTAVGPAWTFDEATGQYYLHSFAPQQPDLNWDNPEVEAAMHATLRFWLDRGVDGLRFDAVIKIGKDPALADNVPGEPRHDEDWPTIHERLRRIRDVLDEYEDRMCVAELWTLELGRFVAFLNDGDQFHMAHNFTFVDLPWDAARYRTHLEHFAATTTPLAWPCWFLENHDLPRVASRFASAVTGAASPYGLVREDDVVPDDGAPPLALEPAEPAERAEPAEPAQPDPALGQARARAVLVLLHALRGTPFLFEGQELGLPNAVIPADRVVDVDGRDPCRAPVPWRRPSQAGPGAGFTTGEAWLPFVEDAEHLCVEAQDGDPSSTLTLARRLTALRRATPALRTGSQRFLDAAPDVLAWIREDDDGDRWLAVVNFGTGPTPLGLADAEPPRGVVVIGSEPTRPGTAGTPEPGAVVDLPALTLATGEALLVRLENAR
jgi:alpha-glucosidase